MWFFFIQFKRSLRKKYPQIWPAPEEGSQEKVSTFDQTPDIFQQRWQWYSVLDELAKEFNIRHNDVAALPIDVCMIHLAFLADKAAKARREQQFRDAFNSA